MEEIQYHLNNSLNFNTESIDYIDTLDLNKENTEYIIDFCNNNYDATTQYFLANIYFNEKKYDKAIEILKKNVYCPYSNNLLGYMYMHEIGIKRNYKFAHKLFLESSNSDAFLNLGYMYDYGLGGKKDTNKAIEYYVKSSNLGNISAQHNLGILYFEEMKDYEKSFNFFNNCIKKIPQNENYIKYILHVYHINEICYPFESLAEMYEKGLYIEKDIEKAKELHNKAMKFNNGIPRNKMKIFLKRNAV